ncbi:MAG: hypothetical protein A3E57_07625 [Candidatus Muproteobacteria bacterium RIFCSPHIGHO2_12_FULL_60_33]|uniref:Uncharacterized protein n=1 Tax=Candidatus Muproteobacteria bacterium RIFCSPLOWO2_01_FULL_60_18 TaxID=1817768 RepID=A0A1F6TYU1_9PROT|nr:MAG: hypothetical protein A3A87_09320 [Candidatus Muproteobacteria bacterium RIFCSPLOWO2_01_FULL_60_18]OGI54452.1 MAG: hypothetical protein A3E57_07625 [Candidatus Muproteobacteria bacterium RIFCSPHIGHO2_12_FULL_60_33]
MNSNEIDAEIPEEIKPVLLELGTALNTCQTFEYSLCFLLSLLSEHRKPSQGKAFQASWDFHSRKMLGKLVDALKKQVKMPDDYEEYLRKGISARNDIVHKFMNKPENGMRMINPVGRLQLVKELRNLREEVRARDQSLQPITDALLKKYGLSTESLKRSAENAWRWNNFETSRKSTH